MTFRLDQYVVAHRFYADCDCEQGSEGGLAGFASIEAEDELVKVGLQVFAAQSVIDAAGPALEVGEHLMDPGQHDVGGLVANDMRVVGVEGNICISRPAIGLGGTGRGDVLRDELVEAVSAVVSNAVETQPSRRVAVANFDAADHQHLALVAAPNTAAVRLLSGVEGQRGFVDLDQARQGIAVGVDHRTAQLGSEHPGGAVRAEPELLLQLKCGHAVRMSCHQISRPEPDRQIKLAAMQDGSCGHRGLTMAPGAFEGVCLAA